MKFTLTGLIILLLCSFISCTKTNNVTTTIRDTTVVRDTIYSKAKNPILGFWVGTYRIIGATDSFYYSLAILSNGTCTATGIGATSNSAATTGPWQLNGTVFTATVTALSGTTPEPVEAITAAYDSVGGVLSGTAIFTTGPGNNNTFYLRRVQ
jgi:hypothetical protein